MTGGFASGHAVVIGVANYRNVTVLPDAVLNDARDVAGVLKSQAYGCYEPRNVHLVLDGDATLVGIREALATVARNSQRDETIIIFFSGHGASVGDSAGGESVLLPVECDARALGTTSLSEAEFSSALRRFATERLLVLIDACHSGGAGSLKDHRGGDLPAWGYSQKSLCRLAQGTGRVLMASCRSSEESVVFGNARNSVFTSHLLDALRGRGCTRGDGVIRVFDIFNYVSEMVKRDVPGRQHPVLAARDLEDNFGVTLDPGGVGSVAPASVPSGDGDVWSQLGEILPDLYPAGPTDQDVWARAGGDPSRLHLNDTGRVAWFKALRTLRQGGGGARIRREGLIGIALRDYPHHPTLTALL